MSERYAYILLNYEKFWNRLRSQNKAGKELHAFVRRGTVGPKNTRLVLFYVTRPFKEIRGFGEFVKRIAGDADDLWRAHGSKTCLNSYEEYTDFMQGKDKATFILFKNFRELATPIPASVIYKVTGTSRMPRGGRYVDKETAHKMKLRGYP